MAAISAKNKENPGVQLPPLQRSLPFRRVFRSLPERTIAPRNCVRCILFSGSIFEAWRTNHAPDFTHNGSADPGYVGTVTRPGMDGFYEQDRFLPCQLSG